MHTQLHTHTQMSYMMLNTEWKSCTLGSTDVAYCCAHSALSRHSTPIVLKHLYIFELSADLFKHGNFHVWKIKLCILTRHPRLL